MSDGSTANTAQELKGKAKETVGDLTDNDRLEAEGAMEEANAKAKQDIDDAKDDLEDAVADEAATRTDQDA
jgi:uncharacterized protein YjbJ (UPF0337 family)